MGNKLFLLTITCLAIAFCLSLAALFIAYTSQETMVVIDNSLTRHVDQYLLERATKSIVTRELEVQNLWLKIMGFSLLALSIVSLTYLLLTRHKRSQPPE